MSRWGKAALVLLLVLAVVLAGLPIGVPMAACAQCVLPAGVLCLLVASLATVVVAADGMGGRVGLLPVRVRVRLWARRVDRPPQPPPQPH
jgi:hypothetical protein